MDRIYRVVARMHRDSAAAGSRSFDNVDLKFAEADFFLEKLGATRNNMTEAGFYFSAFLSAARSVTFAMQAVMRDVDGFDTWYHLRQQELKTDPIARYLKDRRDLALHPGERAIFATSQSSFGDLSGSEYLLWPTLESDSTSRQTILEAGPTARQYMKSLATLIVNCYETFGQLIDSEQYYTKENIERLALTVDDVEESLGFPRGWTLVEESDDDVERRLRALRQTVPSPQIQPLLDKYL